MRWLSRFFVLLAAAVLAASAIVAWFAHSPIRYRVDTPIEVHIEHGSSLKAAARQIEDAGADVPAWAFSLLARIAGHATRIKAGSYELSAGLTPWQLVRKLTQGEAIMTDLVVVEGWTFRQMRAALDAHPAVRHDTQGMSDAEVLARLGIEQASAEGLFFPDTYLFSKDASDLQILARAHRRMQSVLAREWGERAANLPLANPYDALILASIVEKETGKASDRELIAGVFVNRLRKGMLLQTDPAVIYGLGQQFDGNLRKKDLTRDTSHNTYTRPGLPPTPIALPGLASIRASLHPAATDHLYFVARGDGSSEFSRTLDEHNRAVARYQKRKGG